MIRILPIASGSSGNSMYIEMDGLGFLVDIGVSWRACSTALTNAYVKPESIQALFITHTHSDHIKGIDTALNRISPTVFATATTKLTLGRPQVLVLNYSLRKETLPGLYVTAFSTSHDAPGSCGFLFEYHGNTIGYATDLGVFTDEIRSLLCGVQVLVIESNHDIDMLRMGPYPGYLKKRILSDSGHLSNTACATECSYFASMGTKHILLAHLSKENNTPECAFNCVKEALKHTDVSLRVLPPQGSEWLYFE